MAMASETKLNISLAIEVRIEVSAIAAQKRVPFLLPVLSLELGVNQAHFAIYFLNTIEFQYKTVNQNIIAVNAY